jgi:hypothetical protein
MGPKRSIRSGERLPGCTVRSTATGRGPGGEDLSGERNRTAPHRRAATDVKDEASNMNAAQVRRHELHVLIGVAVVLFLGFLYFVNLKDFF